MWQITCQVAICQLALAKDCHLANNGMMDKPKNHIREIRKKREGMTLERLADMTGISITHLSRMETGNRGLSLENAILIARALEVRVTEIDESFADMVGENAASIDQEILQVLPRLSGDSLKSVLDVARRLERLER